MMSLVEAEVGNFQPHLVVVIVPLLRMVGVNDSVYKSKTHNIHTRTYLPQFLCHCV